MPLISEAELAKIETHIAKADSKALKKKWLDDAAQARIWGTAEIIGTAAAVGFLRGKLEESDGKWQVPGIGLDVEMVVGFGLVGAAFAGVFGKYTDHFLNAGNSLVAVFTHGVTRRLGKTGNFELVAGSSGALQAY